MQSAKGTKESSQPGHVARPLTDRTRYAEKSVPRIIAYLLSLIGSLRGKTWVLFCFGLRVNLPSKKNHKIGIYWQEIIQ